VADSVTEADAIVGRVADLAARPIGAGLRERVWMMPTGVIVVADSVCDAFGLLREVDRVSR
jgi:hypothetical protein